jgi:thymidylate synthase (FAD)
MKFLKDAGTFEVLATWPSEQTNNNAQMILEKAGRICYQSEKNPITTETAHKFITNCCKRTHYSVIEHGWRSYYISSSFGNLYNFLELFVGQMYPYSKYMFVTQRTGGEIIVSANLETWRKAYVNNKLDVSYCDGIRYDLAKFAPAIFTKSEVFSNYCFDAEPITSENDLINDNEKLMHIAHTVVYNNHSRGFTHELVRHRQPVFSQESTRYVDEKYFEIIMPPHKDENASIGFRMGTTFCENTPLSLFELTEEMYKTLRNTDWRPEDARQILPTAIKAQIVMSCNLKERRYIHFRRTSSFAHWEIRRTMCNELKAFSEKHPSLFSNFVYKDEPAKDGISGYYICNNEQEMCNDC